MKIGGIRSGSAGKAKGASSAKKASGKGSASSASSSLKVHGVDSANAPDAVELHDHVQAIELIKSLVNDMPEIRMDQVESISNQLREGNYKIDHERIANGFI